MRFGIIAALLAAASSFAAPASAQHYDVFFAKEGMHPAVGAFDFDGGGTVIPDVRVFERALDFDSPVYVGSDPGYAAGTSEYPFGWSALPGNVEVPFEILRERTLGRNLSYWNGVGAPSFGPIPDGEVLVVDQNGCIVCGQAIADGSSSDIAGFSLGTTSGTGSLHQHHDYFLLGDLALSDSPTPGVYLLTLRARPGTLDWSVPFFVVFSAGVNAQQLADAADWVDANLVFPACSDATDNDADGKVDYAGGPGGEPLDDGCQNNAARVNERPPQTGCGLGFETAALLPLWWMIRSRHRRVASPGRAE